jgi:hypothetical protein
MQCGIWMENVLLENIEGSSLPKMKLIKSFGILGKLFNPIL